MKAYLSKSLLILLIFFLITDLSTAAIKSFKIRSDNRPLIVFGKFGFTRTGFLSLAISNLSVASSTRSPYDPSRIGFFLVWDRTPNQLRLERQQNPSLCVLDSMFVSPLFTFRDIAEPHSSLHKSYNITYPHQYSLFIANCDPELFVTMDVRVEAYNIYKGTTKDYLSVGVTQLPSIYFVMSLIYICFFAVWIRVCFKNKPSSVHQIHLLMGALLATQALSMFCNAEDRHHVKVMGTPHGWDVMFYMFHFINDVLLFTVIVLIGAGWSYLKPFLQKKEMIFLMIMIPIRVLGNVALIVIEETGKFRKDWVTWSQVYRWADVICWSAVFFPIVWSIRLLKESSKTDEKSGRHLSLFRQFYRLLVGYLLFTSIGVFALKMMIVDYKNRWVCIGGEEIGTLVFYLVMFYMFRPVEEDDYQFSRR